MMDRVYYSKEAESAARRQQMFSTLAFMMLGLGVGATLALLFAPERGERVRKLVTSALEEGFTRGRETTEDALHRLGKEYPDVYEKIKDGLHKLAS
jgi:gas vesicle protein